MTNGIRRSIIKAAALLPAAALALGFGTAGAQDLPVVKVGVLATGTVNWEMDTIKRYGFDTANGINLEIIGYAGNEASDIALMGDEVQFIVSDFFAVSSARAQGRDLTYVPHSLTVGGVMVRNDGGINTAADLAGKTIAVAGGPVDKSYLLLRAYSIANLGMDIAEAADVQFAPVPQANLMLQNGDADASMNFWHWNARLLAEPDLYHELIGTDDILVELGVSAKVPLLGWVFKESWAQANMEQAIGFLKASLAAKQMLLVSDTAWDELRERMRVGDDTARFESLKTQYRRGIVTSYGQSDIDAAAAAFAIMAKLGGEDLVGNSPTLDPGTFWDGFAF